MSIFETNHSSREVVLLSGLLAKSDVIAKCIVRAVKVTLSNLHDSEYVTAELALCPPNLPDGEYELHFDGRRMRVKKNSGRWASIEF